MLNFIKNSTIKPVYNQHLRDPQFGVIVDSWSLFWGSFNCENYGGRCRQVVIIWRRSLTQQGLTVYDIFKINYFHFSFKVNDRWNLFSWNNVSLDTKTLYVYPRTMTHGNTSLKMSCLSLIRESSTFFRSPKHTWMMSWCEWKEHFKLWRQYNNNNFNVLKSLSGYRWNYDINSNTNNILAK